MDSLKNLLPQSISRHGISRQIKAATVLAAWQKIAAEILPAVVFDGIEIVSFRTGSIKVAVPGASFSQAVKLHEHKLLEGLNKKLGQAIVERIIITCAQSDEQEE
ncbi:DciA family protein [Patescibacteria group bacterium]